MENTTPAQETTQNTKFCQHCGGRISQAAVVCTLCGCQVETIKQAEQPSIVINNSNNNVNTNQNIATSLGIRMRNKWVAFFLCLFLGCFGVHKFYEGRVGMGILYLFTAGLFGFGWFVDCIVLLFKPNPYAVRL